MRNKNDELWILRGIEPVIWTIPYYVNTRENEYEVFPAVALPLHVIQHAAESLLQKIGRPVNGLFYVPKREWLANAHLSTSKNPEDGFSWGKVEDKQKPKFVRKEREGMQEFLDALHQKGIGATRDEVAFWWVQFCNHIFDWLINVGKPVDCFMFKLHSFALRPDWKELLVHTYLNQAKRTRAKRAIWFFNKEQALLEDPLFVERATAPRMIVLNNEKKPRRFIELELSKGWLGAISEIEEKRFRNYTAGEYAEDFIGQMRAQLPITAKLFSWWLTFRDLPYAEIRTLRDGRVERFASRKPRAKRGERKNRKANLIDRLRRKIDDTNTALAKIDGLKSLPPTADPMPAVRTLEREAAKLRDRWGDVQEPEDRWEI